MFGFSELELLAKIREEPENDDYRLILADYYAEHQKPDRAELIRVQMALNELPIADPRAEYLQILEEEVLSRIDPSWTEKLTQMVEGFSFTRGLPEKISLTLLQLQKYGEDLFRQFPIRSVTVLPDEFSIELLKEIATLFGADSVQFPSVDNGDELCQQIRHYRGDLKTRYLNLQGSHITKTGIRELNRWQHHCELKGLNLSDTPELDLEAIETLCAGDWQNLECLDLTGCDLNEHKAAFLACRWKGPKLRSLLISHNPLGSKGLSILLESPLLRRGLLQQKILDLRRCELNADAMERMSGYPELEVVEQLCLDSNPLRTEGLSRLCHSPFLSRLRQLDVPECQLNNSACRSIEISRFAHSLRGLNVRGNLISKQSLQAMQARLLKANWQSVIQIEGGLDDGLADDMDNSIPTYEQWLSSDPDS